MCVCTYGGQRSALDIIPQDTTYLVSGSATRQEPGICLGCLINNLQEAIYLYLPRTGRDSRTHHPAQFFLWILGTEVKYSRLCGNHFTDRASPQLSHLTYILGDITCLLSWPELFHVQSEKTRVLFKNNQNSFIYSQITSWYNLTGIHWDGSEEVALTC